MNILKAIICKNYVLYYILSGEGTFSSNGHHTVNLSQGDLFLIPRNTTCFFKADKDNPWEYLWLGLAGSDTKKIIEASNLPNKNFLRQIKRTEFYSILLELYEMLNKRKSLLTNLKIASLTSQFFYYLVKEFPNHPPVRKLLKMINTKSQLIICKKIILILIATLWSFATG